MPQLIEEKILSLIERLRQWNDRAEICATRRVKTWAREHRWTRAGMAVAVFCALAFALFPGGVGAQSDAAVPPAGQSSAGKKTGFHVTPLKEPRPLPDIRFEDGDGRQLTLARFRGKMVLLNIWATWCPPCRKEMPALDRLQAALGGRDFEIVALSIDRGGLFAVKAFYDEMGLAALRMYIDKTGKATSQLNVLGLPTSLLVDRNGRELWRIVGPVEWDKPEVIAVIRRYIDAP